VALPASPVEQLCATNSHRVPRPPLVMAVGPEPGPGRVGSLAPVSSTAPASAALPAAPPGPAAPTLHREAEGAQCAALSDSESSDADNSPATIAPRRPRPIPPLGLPCHGTLSVSRYPLRATVPSPCRAVYTGPCRPSVRAGRPSAALRRSPCHGTLSVSRYPLRLRPRHTPLGLPCHGTLSASTALRRGAGAGAEV
jgi:hypothetical protein